MHNSSEDRRLCEKSKWHFISRCLDAWNFFQNFEAKWRKATHTHTLRGVFRADIMIWLWNDGKIGWTLNMRAKKKTPFFVLFERKNLCGVVDLFFFSSNYGNDRIEQNMNSQSDVLRRNVKQFSTFLIHIDDNQEISPRRSLHVRFFRLACICLFFLLFFLFFASYFLHVHLVALSRGTRKLCAQFACTMSSQHVIQWLLFLHFICCHIYYMHDTVSNPPVSHRKTPGPGTNGWGLTRTDRNFH